MSLSPIEELALFLRPAGNGVYVVSTGKGAQRELHKRLYGYRTESNVREAHRELLDRIADARVVVLGVPSDVGASFRRGSNFGPPSVRMAMLERHADWWSSVAGDVVDIGDVMTVPQLLEDRLLTAELIADVRQELYPRQSEPLPVSPLTIEQRVLDLVGHLNPRAKAFVIGGDHSVAWPVAASLAARHERLGIVQLDAHTDLMSSRLGIPICYSSWSYHANDAIGRGGHLVQLGIRASFAVREYWESTLHVRQFWAKECLERGEAVIDDVVTHLRAVGVERLYLSNDIDGTDESEAPSTGTPEPGGLSSSFVFALIERLRTSFEIVAADIVEVAPLLGPTPADTARTVALAADYAKASIDALLTSGPSAPAARP